MHSDILALVIWVGVVVVAMGAVVVAIFIRAHKETRQLQQALEDSIKRDRERGLAATRARVRAGTARGVPDEPTQ